MISSSSREKSKTRNTLRRLIPKALILMWPLALLSSGFAGTVEREGPEVLTRLLKGDRVLSGLEMEDVKKGNVVTKRLDTRVKGELAVIGVSRIRVPGKFFIRHYGKGGMNIETAGAKAKGQFSALPVTADVRTFALPLEELGELTECEPRKCKIKANADLMKAFGGLDKSAPDFEARGNGIVRETLVAYVRQYLKGGNAALLEYCDKEKPVRIADEFHDLLGESPYLPDLAPRLRRYLEEFPRGVLPGVDDNIYWMTEKFGGRANRPVFSINHVFSYRPPGDLARMVVASKQLYATHYFEAALGLTLMADDPESAEPGVYMIHISRSRIDVLREIPEFFGRHLFQGVHGLLHRKMTVVKKNMEKAYRLDS